MQLVHSPPMSDNLPVLYLLLLFLFLCFVGQFYAFSWVDMLVRAFMEP